MRLFLHSFAFYIPLVTVAYLASGPHSVAVSLACILLVAIPILLDTVPVAERRAPMKQVPGWVWEGILAALLVIHLTVVLLTPLHVAQAGWSMSSVVGVFLAGNTGAQGFVLAHELVHRRRPWHRLAGRLLLCSVLYEHFYTEHIRGHHKHVGTERDPATARHGERFWPFFFRTVPAQFRSAWALESRRLRIDGGLFQKEQLHNRVLHGLMVGWTAPVVVLCVLGPLPLVAYLAQALVAILMLEGVNFIEHWGLARQGKRVAVHDSWDSEGAITYYMLIGLARHGDHHAHAARPWNELRHFDHTAKMPWGYLATTYCAILADGVLLPKLDAELRRRSLGPYASG